LGFGHGLGEAAVGKGGICIWIAPHIKHMVKNSGHTQYVRAQWVRLEGFPRGDIAMFNIYASNST